MQAGEQKAPAALAVPIKKLMGEWTPRGSDSQHCFGPEAWPVFLEPQCLQLGGTRGRPLSCCTVSQVGAAVREPHCPPPPHSGDRASGKGRW